MCHMMNLALGVIFLHVSHCLGYIFIPDNTKEVTDPRLPVLYNISTSQTLPYSEAPLSAFAGYSFVTASTGQQYFLTISVLASEEMSGYGGSILDLTTLRRYSYAQPTSITNEELLSFNLSNPGYHWSALSPDNLNMIVQSTYDNISFDLKLYATSRAFYYAGASAYTYPGGTINAWVLPACETSGTFSLPGSEPDASPETVTIDPSASLTWYERLWGAPALLSKNSTYFNLYFDNSDMILAQYLVSSEDPPFMSRSSNLRRRNESAHAFVPVDLFEPDADEVWTSPRSGQTYPQKWKLGVQSRGTFEIRSVVGDQEFVGQECYGTTYIGFINFTGVFDGERVTGFGAVEMRYVVPRV